MSGYLLDTNICIHFIKNEYGVAEKMDRIGFENCFISELSIAEMLYGVANSVPTRQAANRQALNGFRAAFEANTLPIADCFEYYAAEKTRLRRAGRPVDDLDLMIGCTALRYGFTLVTRNTKHFANVLNLTLENWIDFP